MANHESLDGYTTDGESIPSTTFLTIWVPMEHHEYCDTAVIGNPFRATREKGLAMFDRMARHLAAFVQEVRKFEVEITTSDFPERAWVER